MQVPNARILQARIVPGFRVYWVVRGFNLSYHNKVIILFTTDPMIVT